MRCSLPSAAILAGLVLVTAAIGAAAMRGHAVDAGAATVAVGAAQGAPVSDASFEQRIAPLLEARCAECHGAGVRKPKGGLRLSSRAALLAGGESGPAIDLAAPDASLLLRAVRGQELGLEMPPDDPLPSHEVDALAAWIGAGAPWPEATVDPEQERFFEERIRPVLAQHCFGCHGAERDAVEGGLRMAGREGLLAGGHHGPAIDVARPADSLLLRAVGYGDRHLRMPPDGPLPDAVVQDLARWVEQGAPWPGYDGPTLAEHEAEGGIDVAAARNRWPFTPLARPAVPALGGDAPSPLDAFVEARLARAGLAPNGEADWPALVRRAHVDLLGLPPTYEQLERWRADGGADRFERLVDELLARPEYGEHWARVWLDLVRFAETSGYERDPAKPFAWRYRAYVVDSFNADKPYDRFLVEQLAGDELATPTPETLVATGFLRLGAWDDEPDDAVQAVHDERDDIVRTVTEGMLGLTVGCARCHDHLFDPIPQEDYYRTAAFFAGLEPFTLPKFAPGSAVLRLADESEPVRERWDAERRAKLTVMQAEVERLTRRMRRDKGATEFGSDEKRPQVLVVEALELEEQYRGDYEWILAARESAADAPPTHLLVRGRYETPGPELAPGYLSVLCASDGDAAASVERAVPDSSGRRLALARWIASPANPLTARVMANRVWQHLFGVGLVATPNDFGVQGSGATHPELLDWLAAELVDGGWSLKALQRTILLSRAYRRSSRADVALALEIDPGNQLLWRQNVDRLRAEGVHDAMLQASGELRAGMPPDGHFFPDLGREVLGGMSRPGQGWGRSPADEQGHRALYVYAKRGVQPALLSVFDAANASLPTGGRSETTTATQALVLQNGEFTARRAAAVASRVFAEAPRDAGAEVARTFQLVLARDPTDSELAIGRDYLAAQAAALATLPNELRIRPALPARVDIQHFQLLTDADALHAPRTWRARLGRWGGVYNGTLGGDPDHGPMALAPVAPAAYDRLRATLTLDPGCEQLGLVFRAVETGDEVHGVELRLDPPQQRASIVMRHAAGAVGVREVPLALPYGRRLAVEVALADGVLEVTVDGARLPELGLATSRTLAPGGLAISVRGEGAVFERIELGLDATNRTVPGDPLADPHAAALESFAQLLFNTNEFVYVD